MRTSMNYEISRNTFTVESSSVFNMSQEFIEIQRRKLMTMMQEFWTQRLTSTASSGTFFSIQTSDQKFERWVIANLKFFDSAYDDKVLTTADSMQHIDKNTYFKNVHLFIDRIKDIVVIKDVDTMRNNLYSCLRDIVMIWYCDEEKMQSHEMIRKRRM